MGKKVVVSGKTFVPYLSQDQIEAAILKVADGLNSSFVNSESTPVLLCVLNGAMMYTSQLMKSLSFDVELATIKLKSYEGTRSTGKIVESSPLTCDVAGRDVIICEDIVDTGNTIVMLSDYLIRKGARSVVVTAMLLKPDVYKQDVKLDYIGLEIPNKFILGYGLDYNELGRALPEIYVLSE